MPKVLWVLLDAAQISSPKPPPLNPTKYVQLLQVTHLRVLLLLQENSVVMQRKRGKMRGFYLRLRKPGAHEAKCTIPIILTILPKATANDLQTCLCCPGNHSLEKQKKSKFDIKAKVIKIHVFIVHLHNSFEKILGSFLGFMETSLRSNVCPKGGYSIFTSYTCCLNCSCDTHCLLSKSTLFHCNQKVYHM